MANGKNKHTDNEPQSEANAHFLPYALGRELESISKNTGKAFDLSLPVEELEAICNKANFPPDAWRERWDNK